MCQDTPGWVFHYNIHPALDKVQQAALVYTPVGPAFVSAYDFPFFNSLFVIRPRA